MMRLTHGVKTKMFFFAKMRFLRKRIHLLQKQQTPLFKLPRAFAPVLHIFARKLLRRKYFCENVRKAKYFH
jgi:hypothetical protein